MQPPAGLSSGGVVDVRTPTRVELAIAPRIALALDDLPLAVDEVGVANGSLRNLSQLNLNNNKIGADGKKALAASKYLRDARVFS